MSSKLSAAYLLNVEKGKGNRRNCYSIIICSFIKILHISDKTFLKSSAADELHVGEKRHPQGHALHSPFPTYNKSSADVFEIIKSKIWKISINDSLIIDES